MPDIMMCEATDCPKSKTCYRHKNSGTKPDDLRQCYWLRDESSPTGEDCGNYWRRSSHVAAAHDGSLP